MEIHKVHVVAQQDVGGLEALHVDFLNLVGLSRHAQAAQGPQNGGEHPPLLQGRPGGVVAPETAVVDVNGVHAPLPPAGYTQARLNDCLQYTTPRGAAQIKVLDMPARGRFPRKS